LLSEPAPVVPSAFDEESTMTPAQLLGRWDGIITEASQRFHVPKTWIVAVMRQESGGRTMLGEGVPIVSRAGAIGLMQVLPGTYVEMAAQYRLGDNPYEPRDNILAGAAYLRWLHHKYGYPAMFAAYNAGPGRLEDHLKGASLPAETRAYIGGIAKTLKLQIGKNGLGPAKRALVSLTQPDGATVKVDPSQVTGIRAALPGEYDWTVKTVLILGKHKQQAIREDVQVVTAAVQAAGKSI
jgi:membrane-bound lytic murein transglycosylase B